jgi:hypothetical protein
MNYLKALPIPGVTNKETRLVCNGYKNGRLILTAVTVISLDTEFKIVWCQLITPTAEKASGGTNKLIASWRPKS